MPQNGLRVQASLSAPDQRPHSKLPIDSLETAALLQRRSSTLICGPLFAEQPPREVLVIHDTTEFRFGREKHRNGLGWINSTNRQQGFLAHFSICTSLAGRPLGSLALYAWARHGDTGQRRSADKSTRHPDRESVRWQDAMQLTGELLHGSTTAIHVMDREGDSSELLALLLEHDQRFVVRLAHDLPS